MLQALKLNLKAISQKPAGFMGKCPNSNPNPRPNKLYSLFRMESFLKVKPFSLKLLLFFLIKYKEQKLGYFLPFKTPWRKLVSTTQPCTLQNWPSFTHKLS